MINQKVRKQSQNRVYNMTRWTKPQRVAKRAWRTSTKRSQNWLLLI